MFTVNQISETEWEILGADGTRIGDVHATYELAVAFLGGMLTYATLAVDPAADTAAEDGLLPEAWVGDPAICFSQDTGDGRDFSPCVWTSRDPNVSTLPLMLQTETEMGHFGAQLAGFITEFSDLGTGTNPNASGRLYDTDVGRMARDLLSGGRSFGVSVDPGAVDVEWECLAEDQDGFCEDWAAKFTAYELIGLTMTPFPAFAEASIRLDDPVAASAAPTVRTPIDMRAAGVDLTRPPAAWFATEEPQIGQPFALGSLGDEWLVDQGDGRIAMPLTITDDLQVAGHGAVWGSCHTGFPGTCVTPPPSEAAYAHFHVGETLTAEGQRLAVGALSASCDHAATHLRAPEARDHYAHNGVAWANVRVSNGEHGPWITGALRPDVTAEQLAVLRAGALSGDWRRIGGALELIAMLAVTTPGFPISRAAVVASGLGMSDAPRVAASISSGEQMSLVASGIVRRCPDCARRESAGRGEVSESFGVGLGRGVERSLVDMRRTLSVLERRTRHLVGPAAEHAAAIIR